MSLSYTETETFENRAAFPSGTQWGAIPGLSVERLPMLPDVLWEHTEAEVRRDILSQKCAGPVFGQFSLVHEANGMVHLIRDRLGLNKLFYHLNPDTGKLTMGHYLFDVARETRDYNRVLSVPAGHYLAIDTRTMQRRLVNYWDLRRVQPVSSFHVERFQDDVDAILTGVFAELKRIRPNGRYFVCLSGGLDSATIAAYARKHLDDVTAVSFSYERVSDDFRAAESIAGRLGLPFMPVIAKRRFDPEILDDILRYGQDWRDFNVHCAWVNHHIARHIHEAVRPAGENGEPGSREAIVLTGDLMNELLADYSPVEIGGSVYYPQPRVSHDMLRRFFVYGLDSGDRELGVFHRYGLTVVQPYSFVAELYLSVPGDLLASSDCKRQLNRGLLLRAGGDDLDGCLLKSKMRAQVGSIDGGTLGLFHAEGITQRVLDCRWRSMFGPMARERELSPMIRGGRYRFEEPVPVAARQAWASVDGGQSLCAG